MVIRQVLSSPSVASDCVISSQTSLLPTNLGTFLGRPTDFGLHSLLSPAGSSPVNKSEY